jgi:hypothetical protein
MICCLHSTLGQDRQRLETPQTDISQLLVNFPGLFRIHRKPPFFHILYHEMISQLLLVDELVGIVTLQPQCPAC